MVRKTLGYVELEWTCPQCGTRNPGPQKMCANCGSAQPAKVEFHQAAEEELITDENEIARAKAGPDVHCPYCGARNAAGAKKCSQCGGDLTKAKARESGRVVGAHRTGPAAPVVCPKCGTPNDAKALKCAKCGAALPRATTPVPRPRPQAKSLTGAGRSASVPKLGLIGILGIAALAVVLVGFCIVIILSMTTKKEIVGQVQAVSWTRTIEIEGLRDVNQEDWRENLPAGTVPDKCTSKLHHTQDEPAPGATEVCGTPYTLDTGTGHGQVVQDCEYKVYADWCTYRVKQWQKVDQASLSGNDLNPRWPVLNLGTQEREGNREETYKVVLSTEERTYTYTTRDVDRFAQCTIGSRWVLKVNALNAVTSIQPAK
jgi:ribosomal protein L40E